MSVVRFVGYLLWPLLVPVVIVVLGLAWLILYCALGLWQTWLRAKRDPRYEPYWWA
jgi:hypothetical protein